MIVDSAYLLKTFITYIIPIILTAADLLIHQRSDPTVRHKSQELTVNSMLKLILFCSMQDYLILKFEIIRNMGYIYCQSCMNGKFKRGK